MTLTQVNTPGAPRHYILEPGAVRLESVTEVLKALPSEFLIPWAARRERALVLEEAWQASIGGAYPGAAAFMKRLRERLSKKPHAHITELENAGHIGNEAHGMMEDWLRGATTPWADPHSQAQLAFNAGVAWCLDVGLVAESMEERVYDLELGVAGTYDLTAAQLTLPTIGRIRALLDWKTSRSLSLAHCIQISVYRYCLKFPGPCVLVKLPKRNGEIVQTHVIQPAECDAYVELFRHVKAIHDAKKAWDTAHPWVLTPRPAV